MKRSGNSIRSWESTGILLRRLEKRAKNCVAKLDRVRIIGIDDNERESTTVISISDGFSPG